MRKRWPLLASEAAGPMSNRDTRRRAYGFGRAAENRAAWWLRLKGYRIVAKGFRAPVGVIDLVARRGRVLALVEVKARANLTEAANALGARQLRRIERAGTIFLQHRPELAGMDLRFDLVLLAPGHWPRHIVDAWRIA